jgi:hypothetical protein
MKIEIGPYKRDLIPALDWESKYAHMRVQGKVFLEEKDYKWYDKIVIGFFGKLYTLVQPINNWSKSRPRKVKIHVDNYDVWSADHTLALIIHPVLLKLKFGHHGSPSVDDEDVPDHLKSTSAPPKENEWDTDDNYNARWAWVLDEMIWAFEQHTYDDCNDHQFHHNTDQLEMLSVSTLDGKGKSLSFNHQKDPSKPPYWVDKEGKKAHHERIVNGRRLFAKYYQALWD